MDKGKGSDLLFLELASESRMNMLRELCGSNLKMQDLARKLDLTATEASRQLQRLSKAQLIQRLPDGAYTVTHFGRIALALTASIDFAYQNKQYFLQHNVWQLPISFVYRLGELSQGVLVSELNEVMIRLEELINETEEHLWVMTPQTMPSLSRVSAGRLLKGVKLRCINNEQMSQTTIKYMQIGPNVERRTLPDVSTGILTTEKEAAICLPLIDGKIDLTAFFGKDPLFLKWAHDLFLNYWDQGSRWYRS